jgi:hypothetical protein
MHVLLIWHADKDTCFMQKLANPHMHCCGETLGSYFGLHTYLLASVDELGFSELLCAGFACALKTYVCAQVGTY